MNTDHTDPYMLAKKRAWYFSRKTPEDELDPPKTWDYERSIELDREEYQTTFQVERWKATFPDDIEYLPAYVKKSMSEVTSDYSKAFYFWVAYETIKKAFNKVAVGDDDAEKMSAVVQSMSACPGPRAAYVRCTELYHSIDITTRLTLPSKHQIDCQEPFVALEQCLEHHLSSWTKYHRTLNRMKEMNEYKSFYEIGKVENVGALRYHHLASDDALDDDRYRQWKEWARDVDPEYVSPEDLEIAEQAFQIKRLFPHIYDYYKSLFDYYKTPNDDDQRIRNMKFAHHMSQLDPNFNPYRFDLDYVLGVIDKVEGVLATNAIPGHSVDFLDVLEHTSNVLMTQVSDGGMHRYPYVQQITGERIVPEGKFTDSIAMYKARHRGVGLPLVNTDPLNVEEPVDEQEFYHPGLYHEIEIAAEGGDAEFSTDPNRHVGASFLDDYENSSREYLNKKSQEALEAPLVAKLNRHTLL